MADPGVLRVGIFGAGGPFSQHRLFIYSIAVIVGAALSARLILGDRLRPYSGFVAGILMGGSACSFVLGILMLPMALIGLIFIVGILGFSPIIAGFVYMRNGIRSFREAAIISNEVPLAASFLLGAMLALGGPVILEETVSKSVDLVVRNDMTSEVAVQGLSYFSWVVDADPIALAYEREADPGRKARLAAAYRNITGHEVEARLAILHD
jgi:hypothetical protein